MNTSDSISQSLTAHDLNEIHHFQHHLEQCISTGILFFDDLDAILENSKGRHKLTTLKLGIIRQTIWENVSSGWLQLDWRPYKKP